MSLNHFNADELPYSYMKWETQKWLWKKINNTIHQKKHQKRKHQVNQNNNIYSDYYNTFLKRHIEKFVKTQ